MHLFTCIFVIAVHCFVQCVGNRHLLEHMHKRQAGLLHTATTTKATFTRKEHPAVFLKGKKREADTSIVTSEEKLQEGEEKEPLLPQSRSQRKVLKNSKVVVAHRSLQQVKAHLTFLGETPLFEAQSQLYDRTFGRTQKQLPLPRLTRSTSILKGIESVQLLFNGVRTFSHWREL